MLPFESDLYWQTLPLFVQKFHSQVKLLRQGLINNKVLIGFLKPNWNSDPSRKRMSWLILNLRSNIGTRWPNDLGPKLNCLYIFLCSLDDPRKSWQQRRAHQLFLSTNRCSLHSHSTNGKTRNERYEIWTLWMQLKYVKRIYFNIINLLYYPLYYFVSDWPRARFDPLLKTILLFFRLRCSPWIRRWPHRQSRDHSIILQQHLVWTLEGKTSSKQWFLVFQIQKPKTMAAVWFWCCDSCQTYCHSRISYKYPVLCQELFCILWQQWIFV